MLFISLKLVLTDANMVTLNLICKVNISIPLPLVGFKPMLIFKSMFHNVRLIREETMIESYESVGDINLLVKIHIRCSISTQQLCFRRGMISFKRRVNTGNWFVLSFIADLLSCMDSRNSRNIKIGPYP